MDAIELLINRTSNGKLMEPAPDAETLRIAYEAAARAPDHHALRPTRVFVVRGDARVRLGELMAASEKRRKPAATSDDLDRVRGKALRAPMIFVVAAVVKDDPKVPAVEQVLSAGLAAHAMLYALQARGFAGLWRTGGFAYDPEVKRAFGLGEKDAIVGFIYAGTAKQPAPESARPVPDAFVLDWGILKT
jgi:nitroreductase